MGMKKMLGVVLSAGLLLVSAGIAFASEIDVLLEKLVDKGVLTPLEAQIIQDETRQDVAKQISQGTMDTMPGWTQTIKLGGDLRLRFQTQDKESTKHARNRGRYRLRFGATANPVQDVEVGFRLASGSEDIGTSTNQSFDDSFGKDDIWIDSAYLKYNPMSGVSLVAGKFDSKDYLWKTTDLIWDSDINPEGASINMTHGLTDHVDVFGNVGAWMIEEVASTSTHATDPFLHYFQGGIKYSEEKYDAQLAGVYYGFNGIENVALDKEGKWLSDSDLANQYYGLDTVTYTNDFDSVGLSSEVGVNGIFGGLPWGMDQRIALFGDYIHNITNNVENDTGWMVGAKFGHAKVKDPSSWQVKYMYGELKQKAWPNLFTDSDRYSGNTNVKGHEWIWEYAWKKNVVFGLDYYNSDRLDRSLNAKDREHLFQADVSVKF
ncbi:MAG TPA: putative porin [Candidatus Bathyarchaeia archaeon]|nr:putative porin [Candidatus Bathyarchaeia archaeon]